MADYDSIFQEVLQDLVRVTHCHGCGIKYNVCFYGYVGEYCDKTCYKVNSCYDDQEYDAPDEDSIGHYYATCGWCNHIALSKANSLYHYRDSTHWPMRNTKKEVLNECILTKSTICIKNYNSSFKKPGTPFQ